MFQSFIELLDNLVNKFTRGKLIGLSIIVAFASLVIALFEGYTSYFELGRLESSINLLEKLQELYRDTSIQQDPQLKSIYNDLVTDLDQLVSQDPSNVMIGPMGWKAIAGAMPWLLFSLVFIPDLKRRETDAIGGFLVTLSFGVIAGGVGLALPTFDLSWINYFAYPVGAFFFFMAFVMLLSAIKNTTKS